MVFLPTLIVVLDWRQKFNLELVSNHTFFFSKENYNDIRVIHKVSLSESMSTGAQYVTPYNKIIVKK